MPSFNAIPTILGSTPRHPSDQSSFCGGVKAQEVLKSQIRQFGVVVLITMQAGHRFACGAPYVSGRHKFVERVMQQQWVVATLYPIKAATIVD
jgi:hypothetical protein